MMLTFTNCLDTFPTNKLPANASKSEDITTNPLMAFWRFCKLVLIIDINLKVEPTNSTVNDISTEPPPNDTDSLWTYLLNLSISWTSTVFILSSYFTGYLSRATSRSKFFGSFLGKSWLIQGDVQIVSHNGTLTNYNTYEFKSPKILNDLRQIRAI